MATMSDLTLDAVREFMLLKGGKVTNHDLVKHFKNALTNPDTRVQARNEFKEIVNTVATIVRSDEGEKYLVLKKKYRTPSLQSDQFVTPAATPELNPSSSMSSLYSLGDKRSMAHSTSQDSLDSATSPTRAPPPYRPPPPPATTPPVSDAPPVPPRKKSTSSNKENSPEAVGRPTTIGAEAEVDESDSENKFSVKECMQKFQRMASESALQKAHLAPAKKRFEKGSDKDDDTHSVTSLDPKARDWMVKAAQSDYHALFKLVSENPRLAKFKDPTSGYTALHWAAKHGSVDVVKLIAGTHKVDVNCRSNGGYTPLHIAMQYGHEETFNLLKDVYGANPNLRDWSGRKPHQYLTNKDTTVSADTFRKIKARKKHAEKDSGFLRIGSLNVRVKKTTEAFSNFLGMANTDKLHKTWGSADNIPQGDTRKMPPPKHAPIKKRKSKRAMDFRPPSRPESVVSTKSCGGDSDSDTAAGFGTNWQATV